MATVEIKKQLRRKAREKILSLDPSYTLEADSKIREAILRMEQYRNASCVFCFVGTTHEIDTFPLLSRILEDGKILAVPLCVAPGVMQARRLFSLDELNSGFMGIPEPPRGAPLIEPAAISLAVIPCLSCDRFGRRLGHGGGYYDRYFSPEQGVTGIHTVMVCREKVMFDEIPAEAHDLRFPVLVTECGVIYA